MTLVESHKRSILKAVTWRVLAPMVPLLDVMTFY